MGNPLYPKLKTLFKLCTIYKGTKNNNNNIKFKFEEIFAQAIRETTFKEHGRINRITFEIF